MRDYNIAIVGVGQLGGRYLQGIVKSKFPLSIFLVDPSNDSINRALNGLIDIKHTKTIHSLNSIKELPPKLDVVIVSTNADVRAEVVRKLFDVCRFPFLILEKVLFQSIKDLREIGTLVSKNSTKCWVNHPKRIFKSYRELKDFLPKNQLPLGLMATGTNWGIACNGLHVIDTWSFLIDDFLEKCEVISGSSEWVKSTRKGFMDLQGSLIGVFKKGTPFILSSYFGERSPLSICIDFPTKQVLIEEINNESAIRIYQKGNPDPEIKFSFQHEYQSAISAPLIDQILEEGTCGLPPYEMAMINHVPFIKGLSSDFFQKDEVSDLEVLPIT